MNKVVVITGPTAVGKTKLSIEIAKTFKTDIINGDAYQIYKKMNIGTAKPTVLEKQGVVHHFMDFLDPSETYSIYLYQKEVRKMISKMTSEGCLSLIVGGSGLYIDSVLKDYRFDEAKRDDEKYVDYSNEELSLKLKEIDYDAYLKIHQNNRKRLIRAIELASSSINKDSRSHAEDYVYDSLVIFLNDERDKLYDRINKRVLKMFEDGLLEEVKSIKDELSPTAVMAIGYKECIEYLNGSIDYKTLVELIQKNSRHYAKRQFTWFKNKENCVIVNVDIEDFSKTIKQVEQIIKSFLNVN